jgi:hypothetical protein
MQYYFMLKIKIMTPQNIIKDCYFLEKKIGILVSKKRCVINSKSILIKKVVSKKNAIIKLKGLIVPKEINTKLYTILFVNEKSVEHIPFYN